MRPKEVQEPLLQAAKVQHQYCFDDCERRAMEVLAEWGANRALPGFLAATLADAFEAGYAAAVFDTIMVMRSTNPDLQKIGEA